MTVRTLGLIALFVALLAQGCADQDTSAPANASSDTTDAALEEVGALPDAPAAWGYEGDIAPANWGSLSEEFAACSTGTEQSPIDINMQAASDASGEVPSLSFNYQPSDLTVKRQNPSGDVDYVQVDYGSGSQIMVNGEPYSLLQFHFHHPSEHTIDGEDFPLAMHLVHQNEAGALAVVGVLYEEGEANAAYGPIWSNIPSEPGSENAVDGSQINAADLLPDDRSYVAYNGSLTTPPCSEGVQWFVLTEPVDLSSEQIQQYQSLHPANDRPVQDLEGRTPVASSEG